VPAAPLDHDWIVVGSGFGGSVSALRLSEKGYSVAVLESGRRFADDEFARSTWDLRRYFWAPRAGMRGIFRMSIFKDVTILSGAGVGGGSLGYANTLYRAPDRFYADPQWAGLDDWGPALAPHYAEAERMLGVVDVADSITDPADALLYDLGRELGVEETYSKTRVGVYFGESGVEHPDPFFDGEGPARTGCVACGRCMVGCPVGAKNTLVKNYLWFAERAGAVIDAEREVVDIAPLGAPDGSDGYVVTTERSGAWLRKDRRTHTARGVVLAAGALGTNKLLARCKLNGSLPDVSDRLGELVRTNSESILAVTLPKGSEDMTRRVAISSSIYPDPDTHIETVTYGRAGDGMSGLFTLMVGDGTRLSRPLKLLGAALRHPIRMARVSWPRGWSERTVILLVMQTLEQRDRPPRPAHVLRRRQAADRAGPRAPQPDLHPGRERGRRVARRAHRRHRAVLGHGGRGEHPVDRAHPRGRGDRRVAAHRGREPTAPRLRLHRSARLRRRRDPGEHRRQPVADDHRARRARDDLRARQGRPAPRGARGAGGLTPGPSGP
jgi:cholesterol oxidase